MNRTIPRDMGYRDALWGGLAAVFVAINVFTREAHATEPVIPVQNETSPNSAPFIVQPLDRIAPVRLHLSFGDNDLPKQQLTVSTVGLQSEMVSTDGRFSFGGGELRAGTLNVAFKVTDNVVPPASDTKSMTVRFLNGIPAVSPVFMKVYPRPSAYSVTQFLVHEDELFAVTDGGTILRTSDGNLWEERDAGVHARPLTDMTFATGRFLATSLGPEMVESFDFESGGNGWAFIADTRAIVPFQGGWVAVSPSGGVWRMDDLWNISSFGGLKGLFDLATNGRGGLLAVGWHPSADGPEPILVTSADGMVWTSKLNQQVAHERLTQASFVNGRFFISGETHIYSSEDTASWMTSEITGHHRPTRPA